MFKSRPRRQAALEILSAAFETGVSSERRDGVLSEIQRKLVDFILVTFLYVERIRKSRE